MRAQDRSPPFVWLGFLVIGLLNMVDGLVLSIFGSSAEQETIRRLVGTSWDELLKSAPALAHYVNTLTVIIGLLLLGFALFIISVSVTGYRVGHRWAWYAMWNSTVYYVLATALLASEGELFTSDAITPEFLLFCLVATVLFQLMGYPHFFRAEGGSGKSGAVSRR